VIIMCRNTQFEQFLWPHDFASSMMNLFALTKTTSFKVVIKKSPHYCYLVNYLAYFDNHVIVLVSGY
jgi:hypothetical protein